MKTIVLASASPRRQEICTQLGVPFVVCPAQGEPAVDPTIPPEQAVLAVARAKAEKVAGTHPGWTVLGADTVVEIDGTLLGKPHDEQEAAAMLRRLSGRSHRVLTGVWVVTDDGRQKGYTDAAEVTFAPLDEADVAAYVASGEPLDKAGAYGIQGLGARYITGIRGDFYTVMGLPASVWRFLRNFN